jgi:putative restriction endonuclease
MTKGVFLHKADSVYDDEPDTQYQFPKRYLHDAQKCVGDWIIYRQPSKSGSRGYHALAMVERIIPDPAQEGMYVALIQQGSYLDFDRDVPLRDFDGYVERGILRDDGRFSIRAQWSIRTLSDADFNRIISRGLQDQDDLLPRTGTYTPSHVREEPTPFLFEQERDRVPLLTNRIVRDRVFRSKVLHAYDSTCAFTGLKFINGGGRAEAEAAHIRPVEHNGPDRVNNGIALSGTVHWMFDRGLLSLTNDLEILVSRGVNDQDGIRQLINQSGRAKLPVEAYMRPHPRFLQWHRENCFKG